MPVAGCLLAVILCLLVVLVAFSRSRRTLSSAHYPPRNTCVEYLYHGTIARLHIFHVLLLVITTTILACIITAYASNYPSTILLTSYLVHLSFLPIPTSHPLVRLPHPIPLQLCEFCPNPTLSAALDNLEMLVPGKGPVGYGAPTQRWNLSSGLPLLTRGTQKDLYECGDCNSDHAVSAQRLIRVAGRKISAPAVISAHTALCAKI